MVGLSVKGKIKMFFKGLFCSDSYSGMSGDYCAKKDSSYDSRKLNESERLYRPAATQTATGWYMDFTKM